MSIYDWWHICPWNLCCCASRGFTQICVTCVNATYMYLQKHLVLVQILFFVRMKPNKKIVTDKTTKQPTLPCNSVKGFIRLTRTTILNYSKTTRKHTVYRRFSFTSEAFIRTDFRCRCQYVKAGGYTGTTNGQDWPSHEEFSAVCHWNGISFDRWRSVLCITWCGFAVYEYRS